MLFICLQLIAVEKHFLSTKVQFVGLRTEKSLCNFYPDVQLKKMQFYTLLQFLREGLNTRYTWRQQM